DELTEQPGPRMTRSWPPPARAAEWVAGRPLRQAHTRDPPSEPPPQPPQPAGWALPRPRSSATACRRQARSSSPRALAGADGLRALQHHPGPRGGTNTAAARKASTPTQPDDKEQVTGPAHHALLTNGSPMGGRQLCGPRTKG